MYVCFDFDETCTVFRFPSKLGCFRKLARSARACQDYGLWKFKKKVLCYVQTRIQERQLVFDCSVVVFGGGGTLPCSCWKISPGVKTGLALGSLV